MFANSVPSSTADHHDGTSLFCLPHDAILEIFSHLGDFGYRRALRVSKQFSECVWTSVSALNMPYGVFATVLRAQPLRNLRHLVLEIPLPLAASTDSLVLHPRQFLALTSITLHCDFYAEGGAGFGTCTASLRHLFAVSPNLERLDVSAKLLAYIPLPIASLRYLHMREMNQPVPQSVAGCHSLVSLTATKARGCQFVVGALTLQDLQSMPNLKILDFGLVSFDDDELNASALEDIFHFAELRGVDQLTAIYSPTPSWRLANVFSTPSTTIEQRKILLKIISTYDQAGVLTALAQKNQAHLLGELLEAPFFDKSLLTLGMDPNVFYQPVLSPLPAALSAKDTSAAISMLKYAKSAHLNIALFYQLDGKGTGTALNVACYQLVDQAVELLLQVPEVAAAINTPNEDGTTALESSLLRTASSLAETTARVSIVKMLLAHGSTVTKEAFRLAFSSEAAFPLIVAADNSHCYYVDGEQRNFIHRLMNGSSFQPIYLENLRLLVANGMNINAVDSSGLTPLLAVLQAGGWDEGWDEDQSCFDSALALVELGAKLEPMAPGKQSVLHLIFNATEGVPMSCVPKIVRLVGLARTVGGLSLLQLDSLKVSPLKLGINKRAGVIHSLVSDSDINWSSEEITELLRLAQGLKSLTMGLKIIKAMLTRGLVQPTTMLSDYTTVETALQKWGMI